MKISRIVLYLTLIFCASLVMIPLVVTLSFSVKTLEDVIGANRWALPTKINIANYWDAFLVIGPYLLNSFIIVIPTVVGSIFFASLAAFGLSRFEFRLKKVYYYLIIATTLIPAHTILGPIFTIWRTLNLINTYQGIILIELVVSLPYSMIILYGFFVQINKELIEAAQIEGCSYVTIFFRIVLPISSPALLSAALLEFTFVWNDFLWPLLLAPNSQYHTATLAMLQLSGRYVTQWQLMAAAAILVSLPPLLLFIILQKYFVRGVLGGSFVKG